MHSNNTSNTHTTPSIGLLSSSAMASPRVNGFDMMGLLL